MTIRDIGSFTVGPLQVPRRAHLGGLFQRVHPYFRSSLRTQTAQHYTCCPATTLNHPIQSNWVISHFQEIGQYSHPYHFLYFSFMYSIPILKKNDIFAPNFCNPSKLDVLLMRFFPLRITRLLGFPPTGVGPSVNGIFLTQKTVSVHSTDGIFPTRRRQRILAYEPFLN